MSLELFSHNQSAFESAMEMLHDCGKAAVVHPTGTGKSYIGFKLCEQFSDKTICWLSPSEYIYKTQLENLKEDSDGWQPENVKFFTYAKLMLMAEYEIEEIKLNITMLEYALNKLTEAERALIDGFFYPKPHNDQGSVVCYL